MCGGMGVEFYTKVVKNAKKEKAPEQVRGSVMTTTFAVFASFV